MRSATHDSSSSSMEARRQRLADRLRQTSTRGGASQRQGSGTMPSVSSVVCTLQRLHALHHAQAWTCLRAVGLEGPFGQSSSEKSCLGAGGVKQAAAGRLERNMWVLTRRPAQTISACSESVHKAPPIQRL